MFFIPGKFISLITFPGIMIHEWAHKFFCEKLGVVVHKIKYFQFEDPAGYVLHEIPQTYKQTFWISIGPLVINSLLAIIFSFFASILASKDISTPLIILIWLLLFWLAISSGMHAFPSDHDMEHINAASKSKLKEKENHYFLYYLAFPFIWLIWLANKLRFFWFDAIYALLLINIGNSISQLISY